MGDGEEKYVVQKSESVFRVILLRAFGCSRPKALTAGTGVVVWRPCACSVVSWGDVFMINYSRITRQQGGHGPTVPVDGRVALLLDAAHVFDMTAAMFDPAGHVLHAPSEISRLDLVLCGARDSRTSGSGSLEIFKELVQACAREKDRVVAHAIAADAAQRFTCVLTFDYLVLQPRPSLEQDVPLPVVVMTVHEVGRVNVIAAGGLKCFYGLTGRESEIGESLVSGLTLEDIAEASEVSIGTVRGQLKAIMRKTGATRQFELCRRLCY
jgi:DNA-binding NarL/FixJ family response regulator